MAIDVSADPPNSLFVGKVGAFEPLRDLLDGQLVGFQLRSEPWAMRCWVAFDEFHVLVTNW
jgi:hypothetical protein